MQEVEIKELQSSWEQFTISLFLRFERCIKLVKVFYFMFHWKVGYVPRSNSRIPGYYDGRYWTLWRLPMFGFTNSSQVLNEINRCKNAYLVLIFDVWHLTISTKWSAWRSSFRSLQLTTPVYRAWPLHTYVFCFTYRRNCRSHQSITYINTINQILHDKLNRQPRSNVWWFEWYRGYLENIKITAARFFPEK